MKELAHEDFINWETINEKTCKGNAFNGIGSAHHLQYTKEDGYVEVTMFTEIGREGSKIDYRNRGSADLSRCLLPQAYQTHVKVTALKKGDLLKLCKYIPNDKCAFYDNLCTAN